MTGPPLIIFMLHTHTVSSDVSIADHPLGRANDWSVLIDVSGLEGSASTVSNILKMIVSFSLIVFFYYI